MILVTTVQLGRWDGSKVGMTNELFVSRYHFGEGDSVTKTTLHWHAHAVGHLCFTTDGRCGFVLAWEGRWGLVLASEDRCCLALASADASVSLFV